MSNSNNAVFLSYASQDATAVQRIADALRAAGVEVWFDQSELVGGDAWDAKIRGQIASCALFVPIISANTQARREGYFRREWKLAVDRTHDRDEALPFLLPVVIDDTTDAGAFVPAKFREVQWTRLRPVGFGGLGPDEAGVAAFCARVGKLLASGAAPAVGRAVEGESGASRAKPGHRPGLHKKQTPSRRWLLAALAGTLIVGGFAIGRPWAELKTGIAVAASASGPGATNTVRAEIDRLRARIEPERWLKGDLEAISPALDRLIGAHPDDAEAWALRSITHTLQVVRLIDPGTKPLETGRTAAEHALRLAPDAPLAHLALGLHHVAMVSRGGEPRSARGYIDRAVAALPADSLTRFSELLSFYLGFDFENTARRTDAWLAADPAATYPAWIMTSASLVQRQPDEVEKWANRSLRDSGITAVRALMNLIDLNFYLRANLAECRAVMARVPVSARGFGRVITWRWQISMAEGKWDEALQELAQVPETFVLDSTYSGPKALLAGLAHQRAGRADAAAVQFREAERLLREKLATDSENEALRVVLAVTLAEAGRAAEARSELALVEPLVRGRAPNVYRSRLVVAIAQTYRALGDMPALVFWLRKLFNEPSHFPLTPASLRLDARFNAAIDAPEIQSLMKEFAAYDQLAPTSRAGSTMDEKSVAVLAFANLSDDQANEYFSDGIAGELLTILQKIPGLRVAARTSAWSFKGKNPTAQEVGEKLGMAHVVEGSVQKSGNRVKITARLSRAATNEELWSESFGPLELSDVFGTQSEIAQVIVRELRGRLTGDAAAIARTEIQAQVQAATAGGTRNPEALQRYLQGRFFAQQENAAGWNRAIALYREAIALDPAHAVAWAEMGCSFSLLARYGGDGRVAADAFREARAAAEKALAINPNVARAHVALGWVQRTADWNWAGAEKSFRRALELAPQDAEIIRDLAVLVFNVGRRDEALAWIDKAIALDPLNAAAQNFRALILWSAGRVAEAERAMQRALELASQAAEFSSLLSWIQISLGQLDQAAASAERETVASYRLAARACVQFARGEKAGGEATLREFVAQYGAHLPTYVAICHGYAGDLDQGVVWMERAIAARDTAVCWMNSAGEFRALSRHPRWPELLRRVGLGAEAAK